MSSGLGTLAKYHIVLCIVHRLEHTSLFPHSSPHFTVTDGVWPTAEWPLETPVDYQQSYYVWSSPFQPAGVGLTKFTFLTIRKP